MATIKPILKAEMLAVFPEAPAQILGELTIGELVNVLQHLMECAKLHQNDIFCLYLIYICIPETLYHHYNDTNEAYPRDSNDPGPMPIFSVGNDAADHCNICACWELS